MDKKSKSLDEQLVARLSKDWQKKQDLVGKSIFIPPVYGYTLLHFLVNTSGWELTFIAAKEDPDRFKSLLRRFAEVSCISESR